MKGFDGGSNPPGATFFNMNLTPKEQIAREKVCLALDELTTIEELKQRVQELSPVVGLFKIGKSSYTRFGPESIRVVQDFGAKVFLDLKYHDIPNTVRDASQAAAELGVYMFNVHASGAVKMMQAAIEGTQEGSAKYNTTIPKIIGVTVLTSLNQDDLNIHLKVPGKVEEHVLHLAKISYASGLDGIVCSAADLQHIKSPKNHFPTDFMYVTPGIQGPNTPAGIDQKRVFTPGQAIQDGASILVVGRAITAGKTPDARIQAGYEILQDMAKYF